MENNTFYTNEYCEYITEYEKKYKHFFIIQHMQTFYFK